MNIGLSEIRRAAVAKELARILADEIMLYTKTRNAHWNVIGSDFIDKHNLFETQYTQLDEIIDSVAEKIRTLGHLVPTTLSETLANTNLKDEIPNGYSSSILIGSLLADHETIIRNLRIQVTFFANEQEDLGTSDFVTGLMQDHGKTAWILRAHLEKSTF